MTLLVAITYYSMMPKSDYMVRHLKTEEQNNAWMDVYLTMKQRYMFGFALGAVASIPFAMSLCLED